MKILLLLTLLAADGGTSHEHCWHTASFQHAVAGCHSDQVCCHCGEQRCTHPDWCSVPPGPPPGHGKYAPLGGGMPITIGDGGSLTFASDIVIVQADGGR